MRNITARHFTAYIRITATRALFLLLLALPSLTNAQWNNPYPESERNKAIYYNSFSERPKYLDPALAYSSDEYRILCQIYEPVVQYHYLKRPYQLVPLTAREMPSLQNYDSEGNPLPKDAPVEKVARSVWTIRLKEGILYQEHPCFARDNTGKFVYHDLSTKQMKGIRTLFDFERTGTRELRAKDYVYQIKRLADPRVNCPIFSQVLAEYIYGMNGYAKSVSTRLETIRQEREKQLGVLYNREEDERENPIVIDYHSLECPGLRVVDGYTFQIVLNQKYPQFRYWLAMPFFSPMPEEAIQFYEQSPLIKRNINLNRYPVGTGAFRLSYYDPNWRIELKKNENFRDEPYPGAGNKTMPLIEKAVYSMEREFTARWWKFLQGYYDTSGVSSDVFSQAMDLSGTEAHLSDQMKVKGIRLKTSVDPSIFYIGFNMTDPIVGGLEEKKCKLRQALSIAINREEYIQIFNNGRGIVAQSPLPPEIFGHREGAQGVNPYTHRWDPERKAPVRRDISEAKKLLAEAGYANGTGEDGKQLVVEYATVHSPGNAVYLQWLKKQFGKLNVSLRVSETDYNRFREKISSGNFQLFTWGWNADYPDPENFLFLFYGLNGKVKYGGENAANYDNHEYNQLFEQMKTMENGLERQKIIGQMIEILQHDAPWEFGFFPESYVFHYDWVENINMNPMVNNSLKYYDIDVEKRSHYRQTHNKPRIGFIIGALVIVIVVTVPGLIRVIKQELR
jgi:ABC-type transport system substrate-binding protein